METGLEPCPSLFIDALSLKGVTTNNDPARVGAIIRAMPPRKKRPAQTSTTAPSPKTPSTRTSIKKPKKEDGDSDVAWDLQMQEMEGTSDDPAGKSKLEDTSDRDDSNFPETPNLTFKAKGATYPIPFGCPACEGADMDEKETRWHLTTAAHARNVQRGIDARVWTGKVATAMKASVWYEEPHHDFAKAARLEPEIAQPSKHAQAQIQETLMAMVAKSERSRDVSRSDSDAGTEVFIITPDVCAEFNGRERQLPHPAYCEIWSKDLKNAYSLSDHMTGSTHAQKLKEVVFRKYGVGEVKEGYRAREELRSPTSTPSRPTASGPKTVFFPCPRSRCVGKLSGKEGGAARCRECGGDFNVPRPSGPSSSSGKKPY